MLVDVLDETFTRHLSLVTIFKGGHLNLFDQIASYENLLRAFGKVEENDGAPGIDRVTIGDFSFDLQNNLRAVREKLISGHYRPSPLRKVSIPKDNGKLRWLSIPTVRDRIIQTSASIVLTPILDREFEECSFAYRKGYSVDKAIRRIVELRDEGYVWIVDADILSFFDEVDHELLLAEVRKQIDDEAVISLLLSWLKAEVVYKGEVSRLTGGIPQGSPVSPLLSNLYLDVFDEALIEGGYRHVRFADDFVILCREMPDAEEALELSETVLKKLELSLNNEKTRLTSFNQGFRFLGMEFIRSMVFKPEYEEAAELYEVQENKSLKGGETVNESTADGMDTKYYEKAAMPDTVMGDALREAVEESGTDSFECLQSKRSEIEPSAGSNPLLQTLYLLEQGAVLSKEDGRFIIIKHDEVIREIPAIKVDLILVFGNIQITTQAMKFCIREEIPVLLHSTSGNYLGEISSFTGARPVLHKKQFDFAHNDMQSLNIAKEVVRAKVSNCKVVLQRYARKREHVDISSEIAVINRLLDSLESVSSRDELMGREGTASARYFSAVRALVDESWGFKRRTKHPPTDPVNSLLSYGYTMLFNNIYAVVRMRGLHPFVGFLHGIRDGHPALVSDMLEEFRAPVVDTVVFSLVLRRSLKMDDFHISEDAGMPCRLKENAKKLFIRAFESKMNSGVTHPASEKRTDYRRCLDLQANIIRRVIEGEQPEYTPFLIK
jgi:CRISPR-associated protein Cas1